MRILILSKRFYTGKDLIHDCYGRVFEFSRSLALRGHQVQGLALDYHRHDSVSGPAYIQEAGLRWDSAVLFPNPLSGILRYLKEISRVADAFEPDILLSVSDVYHVLAGDWLAKKTGLMHVVDLYDNYESFAAARIPGIITLFRKALSRTSGIVCVSHPLKRYVLDTCRVVKDPLVIINAVDRTSFLPRNMLDCRRHFGLPEDKKLIGLGGAISGGRGVQSVFDAHEILMRRDPDIYLVLAGPIAKGTEISGNTGTHYLGELDYAEMPFFFGALDVGIINNRDSAFARYCFPQKFFEMLACHTPVCVASTGEVVDMMASCTQALFQPGNPVDMARAIGEQLEASCHPDVAVLSWGRQGETLSGYLEKLLEGRQ